VVRDATPRPGLGVSRSHDPGKEEIMKRRCRYARMLSSVCVAVAAFLAPAESGQRGSFSPSDASRQQVGGAHPQVVPGVVVVKIASKAVAQSLSTPSTVTGIASLDEKLLRIRAISVQKMFRHKPIPQDSNIPDISRILKVRIPEQVSPIMVARELERDPAVEYAEPVYVRRLADVPNDPMYLSQQHLRQIHAPEAWDIQKGDSTVIVSIVDTGVDFDHEDLAANVWTNEAEANGVPGVDDDGNGFVDDIHGWDFGDNDNDPTDPPAVGHGTHCAGLAAAVTNNHIGVAGVSWNCIYMPVKVSPDDDLGFFVFYGFEGIVYAADNGADIISNSWGGFGYSRMEEEVVAYAHRKGAIVVCAAGNDNAEAFFYPASYGHVISIAAVHVDDRKTSYSNFGPWVDICAPGGDQNVWILSTVPDNKYERWGGTSMATPQVAGVCGLLRSLHTDWTNDQIVRQLLLSADNISALNPQYLNKLGHGRVNAYRALVDSIFQQPDARLALFSFTIDDSSYGNGDCVLERGETILLHCNIQNCSIGYTNSATLQLSCASAGVEILDGTVNPAFFPADTMLQCDFTMRVTDDASAELAGFVLTLETGQGYSREEHFELTVGSMPVLLVDNDRPFSGLPDVEPFFRDVLDQHKILYGYWDVQQLGFPGSETLLKFPIVIISAAWLGNVVNDEQENAVKTYLEGGNSLFISGQDIGEVIWEVVGTEPARAFMRDYLHAEYIAGDSEDPEVRGVAMDPITHGMAFHIWQPGYETDWQAPDVIAPTTGATTIFTYRDGRGGAVKYAGTHKVVYLGFGFEAVDSYQNTGIGDPSAIRTELMMKIINWLNVIEHDPRKDVTRSDTLLTVSARLSGSIQNFQTPTLFWRTDGDSVFSSVGMTDIGQRRYTAEIWAPGSGKSVEYYLETVHPYYTWTSPAEAPAAVHRYPVPAFIVVDTRTVDFGRIDDSTPFRDTTFTVRNIGFSEDSLYVTLDYVNVTPDSAISVSPTMLKLVAGDSAGVTFTVRPPLLAPGYYNARVLITSLFGSGQTEFLKLILFQKVPVGVAEADELPREFGLEQNYPNPFNPTTDIGFEIADFGLVRLSVYDLLGGEVAVLVNEKKGPGRYRVQFDARNLASGVYFYRLDAGSFTSVKKLVLLR